MDTTNWKPDEQLRRAELQLDLVKFHWQKWTAENRAFWRRAAVGSTFIVGVLLYVLGAATINIPGVRVNLGGGPEYTGKLCLMLAAGFVYWFIFFSFIDLMRHRVPANVERYIHRETFEDNAEADKSGDSEGLKKWAQRLYKGLFAIYFSFFGIAWAWSLAVLVIDYYRYRSQLP